MGDTELKNQYICSSVGGEKVVTIVHAYTYFTTHSNMQHCTHTQIKSNAMSSMVQSVPHKTVFPAWPCIEGSTG